MNKYISQRVAQTPPSGIRKFFDIVATMKDVISLGIGEPDFVTPDPILRAGIISLEKGQTGYTSNSGTVELRRALSQHLHRLYGVQYDPELEILVTVGVSEALYLAMTAVLDPGDEVIIPEPCFVAYAPEVTFAGGVPVTVPTYVEQQFQVTAEDIEARITDRTKAILLGYPNNPTGAVMSRARMAEIAAVAESHDLVVLSDEIYDQLVYGVPHTCVPSLPGMKDRTILLGGFSKDYAMTGWRIGYVCANPDLLAAMRAEYDRRRRLIVDGFNTLGLDCFEPKGAFYAFPSVARSGMSSDEFANKLLEEEEVAVIPGEAFGESGNGFVRAAYAQSFEKIEEALNRIEKFMRRHG